MTDWEKCPAVESVPGKVSGNWVFTGTRLPVYALFENLAEGATRFTTSSNGLRGAEVEPFSNTRRKSDVKAVLEHVAQDLRAKVTHAHPVR